MHFEICKIHTVLSYTSMQDKSDGRKGSFTHRILLYSDTIWTLIGKLLYIIMKYI